VPLDFVAIDFETANHSPASPCAVGLVRVRNGIIDDSFVSLFTPPEPHNWFNEFNIKVHGIRPSDVADGPTWAEVLPLMLEFIGEDVLIAHNAQFDMGVLRAAAEAVDAELPELTYLCSLAMSRRTYNLESYRLNAVAYAVGHEEFNHHDALADSDACARIVIHMANRKDAEDLEQLAKATKQIIKPLHKPQTDTK
jgi:DNA polymerase-3 subunit epsilon